MNQWDPATEAEAAMRDALATANQDLYFHILSRSDLLLPVSADAVAGRAPVGWGTWTTGSRTHILAFTSPTALRLCLNEPGGSFRAVPFGALAAEWPNYDWWLAVNPGLPIEAYLPSWFLSQLTQGSATQGGYGDPMGGQGAGYGLGDPRGYDESGYRPAVPHSGVNAGMAAASGTSAPSGRGELRLPGRPAGGARSRIAQSDLAAAISGRIRATGSGRASAAAPPTASMAAPAAPPMPPRSTGYGADDPTRPPYGPYRESDSPYREPDAPYRDSGFGAPSGRGVPAPTEQPDGRPLSAQVTSHAGPTAAETVDAEIIDASVVDGAESYERYTEPEPTARFAERDLGARLREHTRSGPTPTATEPASWTRQARIEDAEIVAPEQAWAVGFVPANETEAKLLAAAETNNTDSFLSTLLLARVILPVPISMPPGSRPRDKYFPWQIEEESEGQRFIAVFTSTERLAEYRDGRFGADITSMSMRFIELIDAWPSEKIQFSINPGTPVGTTLPGSQIVALAAWATEVGLRDEPLAEITGSARKQEAASSMGVAGAPAVGAVQAIVMQRTVPPAQLPFYLERGYDRVSGFVNRASEVAHLHTPRSLYRALGLLYKGSPFTEDDADVHVLRWVAHRPDLYRLPYGGRDDAAMRAMQGWVIERSPFRGNGFAPGDTDVVAEFKVDSARLPHGAQMWRLSRDGDETLVARFDADAGRWVPVAP